MADDFIYPSSLAHMSADEFRAKLASDPGRAPRWIYAAAVYGSAQAQVVWGQMLLDGDRVRKDAEAALRWFRIAALSGCLDGMNMVGRCYALGWGVPADPAEAARWFSKASVKGHAWAQFNLATLLLEGNGVQQDAKGALALLVRSARAGNAKAMNMIGRYREFGWTGPVRTSSALRWYRRAANGGCFRGSFHLGRFLIAEGQIDNAARHFMASIEMAPADFCRDAGNALLAYPAPQIQAIGRQALARAAESGSAQKQKHPGRAPAASWTSFLRRLRLSL